ncbi:Low-density lipoprotein receptor-related protein like [Argiope bruennichi]|uniref:Low-density lipoprotein receptor-related protein like n=1 Tax=Argiope bruennichi TaxID=94029 RepID=A0A8T0EGY3_ARGBR|nr:Low-density lipoprotein receptor-related protein like [Argiope bruennichi]
MNLVEKLNLLVAVLVHFRAYCVATTVPLECGIFQFMCDDGQCIKNYKLCDGQKDCIDESDELFCIPENETLVPCSKDYFRCVDIKRCISYVRSRCNGVPDCYDGSDELNCPVSMCRKGAEFECLWSKQCIPLSKRCDGQADCEDESDERNCGKHRWIFSASHFPCQDFISIPRIWHCDGENDCGDNSDEENCEGKKKSCPNNYCMQNASCMFIKGQYYSVQHLPRGKSAKGGYLMKGIQTT